MCVSTCEPPKIISSVSHLGDYEDSLSGLKELFFLCQSNSATTEGTPRLLLRSIYGSAVWLMERCPQENSAEREQDSH